MILLHILNIFIDFFLNPSISTGPAVQQSVIQCRHLMHQAA